MKYLLISCLSAVLMLASCKSSDKAKSKEIAAKMPEITLSKSSCHGRCPVFSLEIYENGDMVFRGVKFVDHVGVFTGKLDKAEHKALRQLFVAKNFAGMEDSYLATAKDLQLIDLVFGEKASKFHKRRAPEGLMDIVKKIDSIIKQTTWAEKEAP
ncbi:MAG TPA: hypothetical protein ENJ82_07865 [Bacteroidetes bacterium]|nr:hypothetical protein [Bacteroidota bacterium]